MAANKVMSGELKETIMRLSKIENELKNIKMKIKINKLGISRY